MGKKLLCTDSHRSNFKIIQISFHKHTAITVILFGDHSASGLSYTGCDGQTDTFSFIIYPNKCVYISVYVLLGRVYKEVI